MKRGQFLRRAAAAAVLPTAAAAEVAAEVQEIPVWLSCHEARGDRDIGKTGSRYFYWHVGPGSPRRGVYNISPRDAGTVMQRILANPRQSYEAIVAGLAGALWADEAATLLTYRDGEVVIWRDNRRGLDIRGGDLPPGRGVDVHAFDYGDATHPIFGFDYDTLKCVYCGKKRGDIVPNERCYGDRS